MLPIRYHWELRHCLGMDEADLHRLGCLAEVTGPRLAELAAALSEAVMAEGSFEERSKERVRGFIRELAERLCGPESLERQLSSLAEEARLSLGEVFSVVGFIHAKLERIAESEFDVEEALRVRAALGRRVVTELALIGAIVPADASVRISVFERDAATEPGRTQQRAVGRESAAIRTAAHEIRNSLNGAALHLTLVERSLRSLSADDETRQAIAVVGKQINRVASLLTDAMAEHPSAGEATVSLRALCAQALSHVTQGLESQGRPQGLSTTDAVDALLEVLQDVAESTLQSEGRVLLTARRHPLGAVIEVEHGKKGAPESSFVEPKEAQSSVTGRGLDAVVRAVASHGWALQVESKPGRTRFHLKLPDSASWAVNQ